MSQSLPPAETQGRTSQLIDSHSSVSVRHSHRVGSPSPWLPYYFIPGCIFVTLLARDPTDYLGVMFDFLQRHVFCSVLFVDFMLYQSPIFVC